VPISWGRLPLLPMLGILLNAFMLAHLDRQVMAIGLALVVSGAIAALANRWRRSGRGCRRRD